MITIREIAELANVSIGTASFVLNNKGDQMRISSSTQAKINKIAKDLGYYPSVSAKKLRSNYSKNIPVIAILWTVDTRSSLMSRFLEGIHKKSLQQKDSFELVIKPYKIDELSKEEGLSTGSMYSGAIIANASEKDLNFLEQNTFNIPIVMYQRLSDKYYTVHVNSFKTGEMVAQKFISKGHVDIALFIPNVSSQAVKLRKQGFEEFINKKGLSIDAENIFYSTYSEEGGYYSVKRMLTKKKRLPTAVFVLGDSMALGSLKAFHEFNIQVPKDIEIVGHDNEEFTRYTTPSLTTVHLPVEEMAKACIGVLIELIRREKIKNDSLEFKSYLIERESSV